VPHDIDGLVEIAPDRSVRVLCRGTGGPTVVLIAGKGNGIEDWLRVLAPDDPIRDAPGDDLAVGMGTLVPSDGAVLPSVAGFTRVCGYDRPDIRIGADATTSRPQPHTVDQDVADLAGLLAALDIEGPAVIVAHSYGGLIATLFSRTHPDQVAGLVMVDAASETIAEVVSPEQLEGWDATNAMTSPQVREGVRVIDAFARIAAAPSMPPLPAVVLSADKPWRVDLLPPGSRSAATVTFDDWLVAQDRLAAALDASHIADTDSGHDIHLYAPVLVVDAIRDVVDEVRRGG
jgi:pimeloyl-ACP methyl ester carboxylesterase